MAIKIALVVGTILNLINSYDFIFQKMMELKTGSKNFNDLFSSFLCLSLFNLEGNENEISRMENNDNWAKNYDLFGKKLIEKLVIQAPFKMPGPMPEVACFLYVIEGGIKIIFKNCGEYF